MFLSKKGFKISGILSILPKNQIHYLDESDNYNFSKKQNEKLGKIMGFGNRRIVESDTGVSDLAVFGLNHLINKKLISINQIKAIFLVTQTPDQFIPPTSNLIASKFDFKEDVFCLDINQGCAGYLIGIKQALQYSNCISSKDDKILIINADILSKRVSKKDRNSRPLIGDGAAITIIEKSQWLQEK